MRTRDQRRSDPAATSAGRVSRPVQDQDTHQQHSNRASPEIIWWRLDDLLADTEGRIISGWLSEQELITTRHSPWEWEGFECLEDTDPPSSGLAYHLNAALRLSDHEKASYCGAIGRADKGWYAAVSTTSSTPTATAK